MDADPDIELINRLTDDAVASLRLAHQLISQGGMSREALSKSRVILGLVEFASQREHNPRWPTVGHAAVGACTSLSDIFWPGGQFDPDTSQGAVNKALDVLRFSGFGPKEGFNGPD